MTITLFTARTNTMCYEEENQNRMIARIQGNKFEHSQMMCVGKIKGIS